MAEKSENPKMPTEKYEGPGRFTSTVGGFFSWLIPGVLVSGISNLPFLSTIRSENFIEPAETGFRGLMSIKGAKLGLIGSITGLGIAVYGAIKGYKNVSNAEEQFNTIKSQRDEALIRNEGLQAQVAGLNNEVGSYRKSHADGISSRSAHGSHASAAEADKASADFAAAAR